VLDLVRQPGGPAIVSGEVGFEYELGTATYRAHVLGELLAQVPAGVPVVLSDDAPAWQAAAWESASHPVIAVLHSDHEDYYALVARHARTLSSVVCVSTRIAETVARRHPALAARVHTIPCGIPLGDRRGECGETPSVLRIIWAGRLEEVSKRLSDLPRLALALRARGRDVTLDVIGEGPDRGRLEESVRAMGLERVVRLHGWKQAHEVRARMLESDLLVLTSAFEGMPLVAIEALAAGCGVAGTRVSGLEDMERLPDASACVALFEPGDIDGAVECVERLTSIAPPERRDAARRLAEREYSIERCMDRYLEIVRELQPAARSGARSAWDRVQGSAIASLPLATARVVKHRLTGASPA
jgi:glycosyltransferase involved in cell wall biosynthesis